MVSIGEEKSETKITEKMARLYIIPPRPNQLGNYTTWVKNQWIFYGRITLT